MEMESPHEALMKSKELNEGNKLFTMTAYRIALNNHDKSLQFLCAVVENEDDANLIEELGISIG